MDDLKLYSPSEKGVRLVQTVCVFSEDTVNGVWYRKVCYVSNEKGKIVKVTGR